MIAVGLLNVTVIWGDYVFPSLVLPVSRSTAAMAVGNFQQPTAVPDINVVNLQFAAYTIVSIPMILLFIIFLKYFISGMASGAVKTVTQTTPVKVQHKIENEEEQAKS